MDFKKSFCCGFNLSNDDIISVLCKHTILRFVTTSGSENGCGKWHFLVQDLENRATHPHQEFPGVSPPRAALKQTIIVGGRNDCLVCQVDTSDIRGSTTRFQPTYRKPHVYDKITLFVSVLKREEIGPFRVSGLSCTHTHSEWEIRSRGFFWKFDRKAFLMF